MAAQAQKTKSKTRAKAGFTPSMSDEAVKAKTGKGWMGWFNVLNKANAATMHHKEVVALLHEKHGVPGWWSQMITVEFERARGGREKHEKADGYSVSVSKTLPLPLATLYAAVADEKIRKTWFPKGVFAPSSQTKDKYFRGSWKNDGARLEIGFYAKGEGKAQIALQVNKLAAKSDVEAERAAWKNALENLSKLMDA